VGEVPGRVRRPAEPRVLAALDTSASMRAGGGERAGGELRRLAQQARVTVAEVDVRVHRTYAARPLDGVLGGGDTDLRAVFAGVGRRWDVVVYFTDGCGPWPEAPPGVPVVWALLGEGAFGCPWGLPLRL
jgi:predicted metal-dependent peptidase